jgi:hypothetical protein
VVLGVSYHPSVDMIASCGTERDKTIRIWRVLEQLVPTGAGAADVVAKLPPGGMELDDAAVVPPPPGPKAEPD